MVAFRSRRKRRALRTNARRKSRRSAARKSVGAHRPRLTFKSGKWYGGISSRSLIRRGSGTRINPRRRRHFRRNPAIVSRMKGMFSRNVLMSTAKAGAGLAIGFAAMPIFFKLLPAQLKDQRRWLGGVHVLLGLGMAGLLRNKTVKDIGLVIAATGVYDLIAMNTTDFLDLPPLRTTSMLADKLIPTAAPSQAAVEQAMGRGYGGNLELKHFGASYPTMGAPVSRVARAGVGASFERVGASYPSLAYPTVGLSGDNGCEMGLDDMIN